MIVSFQGNTNPTDAKKLGGKIVNVEAFKIEENGHKFKIGEYLELYGLVDYPQFDGEIVKITTYHKDGIHGKAYYFECINPELFLRLNWTYEYRLRQITSCSDYE